MKVFSTKKWRKKGGYLTHILAIYEDKSITTLVSAENPSKSPKICSFITVTLGGHEV
jgi:hypothetical protein